MTLGFNPASVTDELGDDREDIFISQSWFSHLENGREQQSFLGLFDGKMS